MIDKLHLPSSKIVITTYGFSVTSLSEILYAILDSHASFIVSPNDLINLKVERYVSTVCEVSDIVK